MDPYLHALMHKYQHVERMKQSERERLIKTINQPAIKFQSLNELSRQITSWWTRRRRVTKDNRVVEGKVVMP